MSFLIKAFKVLFIERRLPFRVKKIIFKLRKKAFGERWQPMPSAVLIELTNMCNFSCIMCPNKVTKRKKGFMELELFKLALDRCEEAGIKEIRLFGVGESLLHPQFMNMWRMAVTRSFKKVMLYTNGSLLNEEIISEMLKTYNSQLIFSFMGWDRESYEKRYVGGAFEDAVKKLKFISQVVRERNIPNDIFDTNTIFSSEEEKEKTKEFLINTIGLPLSHLYFVPMNYWWIAVRKGNNAYIDNDDDCVEKNRKPLFCLSLNREPGILFDGRVTACGCHAYDEGLIIGDIRKQSIKQIGKGAEFKEILNHFKSGDLRGLKCYGCKKYSFSPYLSKIFADSIKI